MFPVLKSVKLRVRGRGRGRIGPKNWAKLDFPKLQKKQVRNPRGFGCQTLRYPAILQDMERRFSLV